MNYIRAAPCSGAEGTSLTGKINYRFRFKKFPCIFEDTNLNAYIAAVYGKEYCMSDTLVLETQTGIRRYLDSTDAISVMPQYELEQSNRIHRTQLEILQLEKFQWTRRVGCLRRKRQLSWAEELFINKLYELCPTVSGQKTEQDW